MFTWRAVNSLNQQPVVISNITTHPNGYTSDFKPIVFEYTNIAVFCNVRIDNDNIVPREASSFLQIFGKNHYSNTTISHHKLFSFSTSVECVSILQC